MNVAFMRYIIETAGNVQRLYWAMKVLLEAPADNPKRQWEIFQKRFGIRSGLKGTRSGEPHFSIARELNLIEWRGRWRITFLGKTFLKLWEEEKQQPPRYLLLAQLLLYDRDFLVPFLIELSKEDWSRRDFAKRASEIVKIVWESLWKFHRYELATMNPPLPRKLANRTCSHHARGRLRLLLGYPSREGLNLTKEQVTRLAKEFHGLEGAPIPSDYYFRIGRAINDRIPHKMEDEDVREQAILAFKRLKGMTYASARSAFSFIHELSLPEFAVDWDNFLSLLRRDKTFSLHPAFEQGPASDTLFRLKTERW